MTYEANAESQGQRAGKGNIKAGYISSEFSIPKEMKGSGVGTNPEDLLVGSACTCYAISLALTLQQKNVVFAKLSVNSQAVFELMPAFALKKIIHTVDIKYEDNTSVDDETMQMYLEMANKMCMVSNAVRGNSEIVLKLA